MKEYKRIWEYIKGALFWRRSARLEKKPPMIFSRLSSSSSRPSLKPITLKWPPSTSPPAKSPASMISQSTITISPGQLLDSSLDPGTWKRAKSLEFASDSHEFPIPTYYESTLTSEKSPSGNCSPTSSTHPTLIGQLIDPKRCEKSQIHHIHCPDRSSLGLPEIDESDAFTLDSFSYYEGPPTPCASSSPLAPISPPPRVSSSSTPSTTRKSLSTTSSTPPHPPSPRLAFSQHSLPPPPTRKEPRAIGSLTSLFRLGANADAVDERGRSSRGDFSFHHTAAQTQTHVRSPLQHQAFPRASPSLPDRSTDVVRDVPEDVEPSSYIQTLGVLGGVSEMDEFSSGYVPLKRKRTVLGIEGGAITVVVERSASVDEGSAV